MALENNTIEPNDSPQVKLYKRGMDNVDLNEYIRTADAGFSHWLAKSKLNKKEKQQAQELFSLMIQGISDGTVEYKLGGGYNNSIGISNTEGSDVPGRVAGYLGRTLRKQKVYKTPEDTSRVKWEGNSTIGTLLLLDLWGGKSGNIKDIIDLDTFDSTTNKRGTTKRSLLLKGILQGIKSNFDKRVSGVSEYDRTAALNNIDIALNALSDNNISDDEFLSLYRATGIPNLRDMFFTGETYGEDVSDDGIVEDTVDDTAEDDTADTTKFYASEEEWQLDHYPRKSTQVIAPISLYDSSNYGKHSITLFARYLNSLSTKNLVNLVLGVTVPDLHKMFGNDTARVWNNVAFSNQYIAMTALWILKNKRNYFNDTTSGNNLYIKGSYNRNRGTGLVWNIDKDTISETNVYDIPYFVDTIHKEYLRDLGLTSNKKGGIIRKFSGGGTSILTLDPQRNNVYYTGDFTGYDNWHASNIVLPWLNSFKDAGSLDWENNIIKPALDKWKEAGGFEWYNATDELRKHGMQSAGTKTLQLYIIDNFPGLNTEIFKQTASYTFPEKANTNDKLVNGKLQGTDTDFGILTGNRRPTIHIKTTGLALTDWDAFYLKLGYVGRYPYLDHWVPTKNTNLEGIVLFSKNEQSGEKSGERKRSWEDYVGESGNDETTDISMKPSLMERLYGYVPDVLDRIRLGKYQSTADKIYETMLPSIKSLSKIYEDELSWVHGDFTGMLSYYGRGAGMASRANKSPFSDPSLASALMLEGWNMNNELQAKGDLLHGLKVWETKDIQLGKREKSTAARVDAANFKTASDYLAGKEKATLKATHLRNKLLSEDEYDRGVIKRFRDDIKERKTLANAFYDSIATDKAAKWLTDVMAPARADYAAWVTTHPGVSPILYPEYDRYKRFVAEAERRQNNMIRVYTGNRYDLPYPDEYPEGNEFFSWDTFV